MTDIPKASDQPVGQISQISKWFQTAVPTPSAQNLHTQIGVHLEEVCEMLQVLKDAGTTLEARDQLQFAADTMNFMQRQLKSGGLQIDFEKVDHVELLDALCDQIVTSVGVAHMRDMDIESALQEVADSNDSKFGDDGQPIFNEHRKIVKGPRYRSPDLTVFAVKKVNGDV